MTWPPALAFASIVSERWAIWAGSKTVEVDSSHVAFISHVDETVELILAAISGS